MIFFFSALKYQIFEFRFSFFMLSHKLNGMRITSTEFPVFQFVSGISWRTGGCDASLTSQPKSSIPAVQDPIYFLSMRQTPFYPPPYTSSSQTPLTFIGILCPLAASITLFVHGILIAKRSLHWRRIYFWAISPILTGSFQPKAFIESTGYIKYCSS